MTLVSARAARASGQCSVAGSLLYRYDGRMTNPVVLKHTLPMVALTIAQGIALPLAATGLLALECWYFGAAFDPPFVLLLILVIVLGTILLQPERGLMPQLINTAGGYRSVGRSEKEADKIRRDATAIADAGAFGIVVEGTVEPLAREITATIAIPTIGIGASSACDGQILVSDDMLGLFTDFKPRFVKHFAELAPLVSKAAEAYSDEVKARSFPGPEHTFKLKN